MTEGTTKEAFSDSSKDSAKSRERKEKQRPLTKVVIRRLPPTMSEESFLEQISPVPDNDYFYFVSADKTLGQHAFCRAYINFSNPDDIFVFKDKFDNYIFVDSKGHEFPAVVEYAPYQGVPKRKSRKKDPKCATIETDSSYIEFLASLNDDENDTSKQENKMEFSYQFKDDKKITSTPLLEFIAARKYEKQRARDERKEERRKRDIERKKQRDEERRKRKQEASKLKPNKIIEENSDDTCSMKDGESDKVKVLKSRDEKDRAANRKRENSGLKSFQCKDREDDRAKSSQSKYQKDDIKIRGKSYRDQKRFTEDQRKRNERSESDQKSDRPKSRDDKSSVENEFKSRKFDAKDRPRDRRDDKKDSDYKSGEKSTKKYDGREFRNETVKSSDRKYEVKKYSETRRERENRRQEIRRADYKKNDSMSAKLNSVKSDVQKSNESLSAGGCSDKEIVPETINERTAMTESKDDDCPNQTIEVETESVKDVMEDDSIVLSNQINGESVNYVQKDANDGDYKIDCEKPIEVVQKPRRNSLNSGDSKKISEDLKYRRYNSLDDDSSKNDSDKIHDKDDKFNYRDDKKDPRTERRIRNKDRPSMAIYQPGRARHNAHSKDKPVATNTKPTSTTEKVPKPK